MILKFALLGAWHSHTSMHVREAAERPDEFQLVGMYDSDPAVIARNKQRWSNYFPDIHVFPTIESLLDSDAEAVVIEGHIYQNLTYARQALESGKHVLLEKPAGTDLDELKELTELSRMKGLMFQKAYMWRYNPAVHCIIELASAGALGDIFYYRGHIPKPKGWYPQLGAEIGRYHGDLYFEMAGHLVDIMVMLMGEPKKVYPVLGRHYDADRRWVDNAVVVHEFDRGSGTLTQPPCMWVWTGRAASNATGQKVQPFILPSARTICLYTSKKPPEAINQVGRTLPSLRLPISLPYCVNSPPVSEGRNNLTILWNTTSPCSACCS